ncbi:hypothetical protein, partial [uncultured Corynebacterium sp.]|uniref:hypothetical protein n=1 Tax=uncultured Corynebacterium sp. TaxID=159447 RepID=UPI0025DC6E5D
TLAATNAEIELSIYWIDRAVFGSWPRYSPHLARPLDLCRGAQNTMADFVGDVPHDFPAA